MVTTFKTSPTNVLSAQPAASGEKIILRSNNAADTMNVVLTGTVSGSPDSETIALTGKKEVQSTKTYSALGSITLASSATGTVTAYGQGVAGTGDIRVNTVPATGTTLTLGLTGFTDVYTFRSPARFTIQTLAFASIAQGDYIDIHYDTSAIQRFWFDKDAAGTGAPSNPGAGLHKVDIVTGDTAAQVATKLNTSFVANLGAMATSVLSNVITLTQNIFGTGSAVDGTGGHDTGFTITTIEAGTASATYQIRTGYHTDGTAITTSQVATNIKEAINTGSGEGSLWSTDTSNSPFVDATVQTNVVTLTDRLAIGRQLTWAASQSSTHFTIRQVGGATTGNTIANIRAAITQLLSSAITLDTETLAVATLPAGVTPTSDWVWVGGKKFTISLTTAQTGSALAFKYQTSNTQAAAREGDTSISITTTSGTLSNRDKLITPSEVAEYVRLVVTSNPNTLDTAVNAKLISG